MNFKIVIFLLFINLITCVFADEEACPPHSSEIYQPIKKTPTSLDEAYINCMVEFSSAKLCQSQTWSINNCQRIYQNDFKTAYKDCRIGKYHEQTNALKTTYTLNIPNMTPEIFEKIITNEQDLIQILSKVLDSKITSVGNNTFISNKTLTAGPKRVPVNNRIKIFKNPNGSFSIISDQYSNVFISSEINLMVGKNGGLRVSTDTYFKQSAIETLDSLNKILGLGEKLIDSNLDRSNLALKNELEKRMAQ